MMSFVVLLAGIVFVVLAIAVFKIHPFLALISAGILVGLLSPIPLNLNEEIAAERERLLLRLETGEVSADEYLTISENLLIDTRRRLETEPQPPGQWAVDSLEVTTREFGATAASIGIVIVLAAIIGQCLMESGGADKITRRFLAFLGRDRAPIALMSSGYVLSVPVFFDTVFFLLVPLARALRLRTGSNFVLYIGAIASGAVITHSLVPPTPGPLLMVDNLGDLGLDLGTAILFGFLLGFPAAAAGLVFASYLNRRHDIPVREALGADRSDLEAIVQRPESDLPGFVPSILPVILPVVLITGSTVLATLSSQGFGFPTWLLGSAAFFGNKNMALLVGALCAALLLIRSNKLSLASFGTRMEPAMMSAGIIILITSAGGAFGKMLARTGIAESLNGLMGDAQFGVAGYLLLAWLLAAIMKTAQGSGTVSIITASGMMAAILTPGALACHPIYLFAAIGFGSMVISWMNDSGFWVVCKMSGFTEKETLRIWTPLLALIGTVGLVEVLLLSALFPLS